MSVLTHPLGVWNEISCRSHFISVECSEQPLYNVTKLIKNRDSWGIPLGIHRIRDMWNVHQQLQVGILTQMVPHSKQVAYLARKYKQVPHWAYEDFICSPVVPSFRVMIAGFTPPMWCVLYCPWVVLLLLDLCNTHAVSRRGKFDDKFRLSSSIKDIFIAQPYPVGFAMGLTCGRPRITSFSLGFISGLCNKRYNPSGYIFSLFYTMIVCAFSFAPST